MTNPSDLHDDPRRDIYSSSDSHNIPNNTDSTSHDRAGMLAVAAEMAFQKGRHAEAIDLYQQAIEIREKAYGQVHRKLVPLLNGLGLVLTDVARYPEAERTYNRALNILEACPTQSKVREIEVLENLSKLLRKAGRTSEAERIESCLESVRNEEGQAPLLLQLARGLTPSTTIDVTQLNEWLDQVKAADPKARGALAAGASKTAQAKSARARNIKIILAAVAVSWIGWLVYMFTQ